MRYLILFALITALQAEQFTIRGVPDHGRPFTMKMNDTDSIGSIYKCMDRVHKPHFWSRKHGGVCEISPGSIRPGKHMQLSQKYKNVWVTVSR